MFKTDLSEGDDRLTQLHKVESPDKKKSLNSANGMQNKNN